MTRGYTPTDNGIAHYAARGMDDMGICEYDEAKRRWGRWLAAHDVEIRAEAWEEGRIAEHDEANGWGDAVNPYQEQEES